MPPGWDPAADVRQVEPSPPPPPSGLWGFGGLLVHTGSHASTVSTPRAQKAVPYPVFPPLASGLLSCPCLGLVVSVCSCLSLPLVGSSNKLRSQSRMEAPSILSLGVFSASRRFWERWSKLGVWAWCRKVRADEAAGHVSCSGEGRWRTLGRGPGFSETLASDLHVELACVFLPLGSGCENGEWCVPLLDWGRASGVPRKVLWSSGVPGPGGQGPCPAQPPRRAAWREVCRQHTATG